MKQPTDLQLGDSQHDEDAHSGQNGSSEVSEPLLSQGPISKAVAVGNAENNTDSVGFYNPGQARYRYVMLVFICIAGIGDYFAGESTAALQGHVLNDLDISETKYMGLYSAYMWASIVSSLFGGYLIDRLLGVRWGAIVFSFLLTVAQTLYAGSAMLFNYWLMYGCMIMYGLCNVPLSLATYKVTAKWFKSRELNTVMALRVSIPRAGSFINMNVMEGIYSHFRSAGIHFRLGICFLVGASVCFVSFLSTVVLGIMDYKGNYVLNKDLKQTDNKENSTKLSGVRSFPVSFWILVFAVDLYYLVIFPFIKLGLLFFQMKYKMDPQSAGTLNGLIYLLSAILMPVFGLVVDKVGRNLVWLLGSVVISTVGHVIFAFTFINPYIPTTLLGVGYSLFTTTAWPLVAQMVELKQLGTAYGIMNAIIGLSQAGGAYLTGYIVEESGYLILEVFFIACVSMSLILGVTLWFIETTKVAAGQNTRDPSLEIKEENASNNISCAVKTKEFSQQSYIDDHQTT